jgi:Na+-transporting NADH:ubiquinone oxidoreductase subunit F
MAKETFQARVVSNRLSTAKIFETVLELVDPPTFSFKAGQFVTVPVGDKVLRSYSIASTPRDTKSLLLIVDISPDGPGSRFFAQLREGDAVAFQGPYGAFCVKEDTDQDLLLVATGTGIAPIRGMIVDLIFHEELLDLAAKHPNLTYYPTLSQPQNGEWDGMKGRVTAHLPHYVSQTNGKSAFLCGSKGMLKDVREILMGLGMDRKKIKQEQFF